MGGNMNRAKRFAFTAAGLVGALVGAYFFSGLGANAATVTPTVSRSGPRDQVSPAYPPCTPYLIINVRGSGEDENKGAGVTIENQAEAWLSRHKIPYKQVELKYPAASVPRAIFLSLFNAYDKSESQGVSQLTAFLNNQTVFCGTAQQYLILGYSQGAQVVDDTLQSNMLGEAQFLVDRVVLYGDPTFNSLLSTPVNFDIPSSLFPSNHGILGARSTDFPKVYSSKILEMCAKNDPVCGGWPRYGGTYTIKLEAYHHQFDYDGNPYESNAANWLISGL
jgi:hypothetical protein